MDESNFFVPLRGTITTKPWRSQEDPEVCCPVYSTKWRVLQKRLLPALPEVYRRGRCQICPRRSTRGGLRRSHGVKVPCQEDHEGWLLLVHDAARHSKFREEVWQLPKVWERSMSPRGKNDDHFLALAVRAVGDQHYGPPITRKETSEVPTRLIN